MSALRRGAWLAILNLALGAATMALAVAAAWRHSWMWTAWLAYALLAWSAGVAIAIALLLDPPAPPSPPEETDR